MGREKQEGEWGRTGEGGGTQNLNLTVEMVFVKTRIIWASLVAQWLRICLLMQGTRVRALVWEDPTCHGAAEPVSHNC